MIDLPPPTVQECVRIASPSAAEARAIFTVSGDATQVRPFLGVVGQHPVWSIEADAEANGIRFLRLTAPADLPYRDIGGLIYEAQRRRLQFSFDNAAPAEVDMSSPDDARESANVGWSADAPPRAEDPSFYRFIVSGDASAVDEFAREAEAEGWSLEAQATASTDLVFAQFRVPADSGGYESFVDRYLAERPRRLNIAGVTAKAEVP